VSRLDSFVVESRDNLLDYSLELLDGEDVVVVFWV
jgi:hypothetical protein